MFDAGALIALERRDRRMLALLDDLVAAKMSAHAPAGVVAQVWRGSPRQHAIRRLLVAGAIRVHPLTDLMAYAIGVLLAASRSADVIDAHVVLLARSVGGAVLTSDLGDLRRLDASLELVAV